jgi:ribosome maturation factor RimP
MNENLREKLENLIKPVVTAMGYELWGIELHAQGAHSILRVFIDSDQGVNLDDCSRVSYQLEGLLDVENPITYKYTLEVSSPGLDRALLTFDHFRRFIGSMARIKLISKKPGTKHNYLGKIMEVKDDIIKIMNVDGEEMNLKLEQIDKARLAPNFEGEHHE